MTGLLLAAALAAAPAGAASFHLPASSAAFVAPSTAAYFSVGPAIVGAIRLRHLDVFDPSLPGEDWWPFRVANKLHIATREHVVRRELLLREGEPWDPVHALESERNLRATSFLRAAEIRPSAKDASGRVDLDVRTQDSWTTQPQLSVGTEGGDRFFIWGIEELNLLGYGKAVSYLHSQVGPDTRNELRYQDPQLRGTRGRLTGLYATTPRGDEIGALLHRPFFSIDTSYSASALWTRIIQEDVLYQSAEETTKFIQNHRTVSASLGAKVGASDDPVQRFIAGTHYSRDRFDSTSDTSAGTLPPERELSGPVAGYALIQPRFIKETYINRMERVEDFNLGNELTAAAGAMLGSFGSDRDRWTLSALDQQGLSLGPGRFLLGQAGLQGRMAGGKLENAIFFANLNLIWKTFRLLPQTWVAHLEWNTTRSLDRENQLILGGNTGLRGYKNNSFTGGRSVLLNLEDRFFLTHEFFHLLYVGGAVFFDAGAAVPEGGPVSRRDFKSDVGLGLRFASSRSTRGSVVRIDLAYALDRGPGSQRWVVSIRGNQAFEIFNSTNRNVLSTPAAALGEESVGARLRRR